MYCRNCGHNLNDQAVACTNCGVDPKAEKKFCSGCGVETNENQVLCVKCGVALSAPSAKSGDDNTVGIVAYIPVPIITFVIAIFMHNNNKTKDGSFHLRQSLGLNCLGFAVWLLGMMIAMSSPFFFLKIVFLFWILMLGVLTLFIIGLVNVVNKQVKPIPIFGALFESWFGKTFE